MKAKTARRFLVRNAHKIARRKLEGQTGWIALNAFDRRVLHAKETLGIKRTIPELLRKQFRL
jgi:hypothetical protein